METNYAYTKNKILNKINRMNKHIKLRENNIKQFRDDILTILQENKPTQFTEIQKVLHKIKVLQNEIIHIESRIEDKREQIYHHGSMQN